MAAKKKTKKTKKRSTKAKKATSKKVTPKKKAKPSRKLVKKKASAKTTAVRKTSPAKLARKPRPRVTAAPYPKRGASHSGDQSGDLQGLSRRAVANSESVDELLEEGNAFEAGAVSGVEAAENADESEVQTHEVPEDDVPEEYLDEK